MCPRGKSLEDASIIGTKEGVIYKLKGHSEATLIHDTTSRCELWNRRIAHINYKYLAHVSKVVTYLPDVKIDFEGICKGYAKGKNIKNPFPKSDTKLEGSLEFIHSDVCGPMQSTSLSGYVYYVTFIDSYSRKTWVYFFKSKYEVFGKFKELLGM